MPPKSSAPPTIVVAPDAFKGSLSASEAAEGISAGLTEAIGPDAVIRTRPMADGGEGTLDALLDAWAVEPRSLDVDDALGRPRRARWGLSGDSRIALIEAAEANGLPHVADVPARPLEADSTGVGQLTRAALDAGAEEIVLCVGGSASTDGGLGLLKALGLRAAGSTGDAIGRGGGALDQLRHLDLSRLHPRARDTRWRIAVDVDHPLTGPHGSAAVFGPQKGARTEDIARLDAGLARLAEVLLDITGVDVAALPGAGAAGGIPAILYALLGAELVPGAELVADAVGLDAALVDADLVVTGEGAFDAPSLRGKVVGVVARRAAAVGVPALVLAGSIDVPTATARAAGIVSALSIAPGPRALPDLQAHARPLLHAAAAAAGGLLSARSTLAERPLRDGDTPTTRTTEGAGS